VHTCCKEGWREGCNCRTAIEMKEEKYP
jgi:hypothetical protein